MCNDASEPHARRDANCHANYTRGRIEEKEKREKETDRERRERERRITLTLVAHVDTACYNAQKAARLIFGNAPSGCNAYLDRVPEEVVKYLARTFHGSVLLVQQTHTDALVVVHDGAKVIRRLGHKEIGEEGDAMTLT